MLPVRHSQPLDLKAKFKWVYVLTIDKTVIEGVC